MKDGFLLQITHYPSIQKLSVEEKAELLDAIFEYNINHLEPIFESRATDIIFSFLRQQFDRDEVKYQSIVERNRKNGINGGRHNNDPKKPSGLTGKLDEPKEPSELTGNPDESIESKRTDNDFEKNNIKKKRTSPPDLSFASDIYIPIIKDWLEYKAARKQTYKSPKSIELFYHSLIDYSKNDPKKAIEIVNKSMSNNWAGIFAEGDNRKKVAMNIATNHISDDLSKKQLLIF